MKLSIIWITYRVSEQESEGSELDTAVERDEYIPNSAQSSESNTSVSVSDEILSETSVHNSPLQNVPATHRVISSASTCQGKTNENSNRRGRGKKMGNNDRGKCIVISLLPLLSARDTSVAGENETFSNNNLQNIPSLQHVLPSTSTHHGGTNGNYHTRQRQVYTHYTTTSDLFTFSRKRWDKMGNLKHDHNTSWKATETKWYPDLHHMLRDVLWSNEWGPQFFQDTMSRDRFREIMKFIRFDLKDQRSASMVKDKFALVSEVWDSFIENCSLCYVPRVNDDNRPPNQSLPEDVVMKLMAPYLGKGINVTTDNCFTSVSLAEKLKMQSTSLVGTVNYARQENPQSVKTRNVPLYDTIVMKNNQTTLTVYQGKINKNILVLSTLHPNISIGNDQKHLPETVSFYNATKYGVYVLDRMARKYSVKAEPRLNYWKKNQLVSLLANAQCSVMLYF
ncbi:hypothetical protein PR048_030658 [Dryococelus australis]|uniref:PiggyBac transposable element-derived protein domain-containing protein n=1 Tax=Dryococelus australis TaxID=614101 RepID=A0ABQ9GC52_9NEOP|nr:hypothetical protein PR048_030658 [Dryococelus australis]